MRADDHDLRGAAGAIIEGAAAQRLHDQGVELSAATIRRSIGQGDLRATFQQFEEGRQFAPMQLESAGMPRLSRS